MKNAIKIAANLGLLVGGFYLLNEQRNKEMERKQKRVDEITELVNRRISTPPTIYRGDIDVEFPQIKGFRSPTNINGVVGN